MKTVKKNKEILRASDSEAEQLAKQGWKYCPKSEWRKRQRNKAQDEDADMFKSSKKKKKGKKLDKKTS